MKTTQYITSTKLDYFCLYSNSFQFFTDYRNSFCCVSIFSGTTIQSQHFHFRPPHYVYYYLKSDWLGFYFRLCHSTWLFCFSNTLKIYAFSPNFPLVGSVIGGFYWLFLWNFKEIKHQPFSRTQPYLMSVPVSIVLLAATMDVKRAARAFQKEEDGSGNRIPDRRLRGGLVRHPML